MESLFSYFDYDLNANTNTQLQTASGMTCYRINNTTQWLEDILTPNQRKQAINLCRRMHLTTVKEGTEAYAAVVEEVALGWNATEVIISVWSERVVSRVKSSVL